MRNQIGIKKLMKILRVVQQLKKAIVGCLFQVVFVVTDIHIFDGKIYINAWSRVPAHL